MMNRVKWWLPLLLMALPISVAAAGYLYVPDKVNRIGIRLKPAEDANTLMVVATGERLEILGEKNDHYQVRTENGKEGWVAKKRLQQEPPASLRIELLQQEMAQLRSAHRDELKQQERQFEQSGTEQAKTLQQANATVTEIQAANMRLESELYTRDKKIDVLQSKLEDELNGGLVPAAYRIHAYSGAALTLLLIGYILGRRSFRRYVAQRLGGLEL